MIFKKPNSKPNSIEYVQNKVYLLNFDLNWVEFYYRTDKIKLIFGTIRAVNEGCVLFFLKSNRKLNKNSSYWLLSGNWKTEVFLRKKGSNWMRYQNL